MSGYIDGERVADTAARVIERLTNKSRIDRITMDNFIGQLIKLEAEVKQLTKYRADGDKRRMELLDVIRAQSEQIEELMCNA